MALLKNFATSTVAIAPSPATSGTSVTVASGHGSRFVAGHPVIVCSSSGADPDTSEVWMLDDIVGDVFTITREHEDTSARTVEVGDIVMQGPTAGMFNYPTREGATRVVPTTVSGTAIDITKEHSVKALTGDVTLTFSGTPTSGDGFRLTLNADSTARTVTLPADIYSIQRQGVVGQVVVPASGTLLLGFRYTGARWEMLGDPAATVGSGTSFVKSDYPVPTRQHFEISFDPKAVCDGAVDRLFLFTVGAWAPNGIICQAWRCSFEADPTTEADLDIKRADAFIGVANAAVMDVCDTATGASSESTAANINGGATIATGKVVYLEFGTAYTEANHQIIFELEYVIV